MIIIFIIIYDGKCQGRNDIINNREVVNELIDL